MSHEIPAHVVFENQRFQWYLDLLPSGTTFCSWIFFWFSHDSVESIVSKDNYEKTRLSI